MNNQNINDTIKFLHDLAMKGPIATMLTLGGLMIVGAIVSGLKIWPGVQFEEHVFDVLISVGTLLLLCAAALRFYEFKMRVEIEKQITGSAIDTLKTQQEAPKPPL